MAILSIERYNYFILTDLEDSSSAGFPVGYSGAKLLACQNGWATQLWLPQWPLVAHNPTFDYEMQEIYMGVTATSTLASTMEALSLV